jgi:signal transduction histidine kinase
MDLHDGTIQAIYGVGLKLEYCIGRLESEPGEVRADLDNAIEDLNKIIRDIRNYIFDLRPLRLQGSDLVSALEELITETRVNTLMSVSLDVSDEEAVNSLTEYQASQLFAIAHEALANASKHSQAKNVRVGLETSAGRIVMVISDDGRGMEVDGHEHPTGRGLGNMTERTLALHGSFKIDSRLGAGTSLTFEVPLDPSADYAAALLD